ncbi:MAG: helix-turn-helix domain-containing protein, partial [Actinomycetota bacterium]|nr:helix-turn-helix domain-containing protein [Actinomycetota bacterium]
GWGGAPAGARAELIRAAEQLFAEHSVEGVSLRAINRAAGQRNASALQYHFADRDGLLRAVLAKHEPEVSARRHALLDRCEASPSTTVRDLSEALVLPLVPKLTDPDGGRAYLRIAGQLVNEPVKVVEPEEPTYLLLHDEAGSVRRWTAMIEPHMPDLSVGAPLHRRFAANRFTFIELARRAQEDHPGSDHRLFASHLVDLVAAIVATPISAETANLIDPTRRR